MPDMMPGGMPGGMPGAPPDAGGGAPPGAGGGPDPAQLLKALARHGKHRKKGGSQKRSKGKKKK
jgi:hypothetical protein